MLETNTQTNSVPVEPDRFVRSITRTQGLILLVLSIIICWGIREVLPSFVQIIPHVVWFAFHVAYLGILGILLYRAFTINTV